jgi:hypothetical protein
MVKWRYFLEDEPASTHRRARQSLMRLREGDPALCAERLDGGDRGWRRYDHLYRQWYLGSDYDYAETTAERANEVIQQWLASGRITRLPDSRSDRPDEVTIARWAATEAQARAIWASVPTPPGIEDIHTPGPDDA